MSEYDDDRDHALTASLRQMAAMDATGSGASPEVRAHLLAQVRAVGRDRRRSQMKAYALAAGLAIATSIPVWQLSTRTAQVSTPAAAMSAEVATGFYPLSYSAVPVTQGSVVRLELSPSALAALGVEPPLNSRQDRVMADVFVGEDGLARAVRFVQTAPRDK